ncbi:unnamed protein product [Paramecium sonneborni]|uniref:Uncharacterized protein n=1 Tax=Paramecium sonneborni TaxID=65129 RepID=A0A8S1MDI6_9CILI|nr:unnamed protein product [Paramecium sonneborni]
MRMEIQNFYFEAFQSIPPKNLHLQVKSIRLLVQ